MSRHQFCGWLAACAAVMIALPVAAEVQTTIDRNDPAQATADFAFKHVARPSGDDAATNARFTLVDGRRDGAAGELSVLHDGKVPSEKDQPSQNFFFAAGSDGGRLAIDLGSVINIRAVNTYSWHAGTRAPQVYTLYASDGKGAGFDAGPKRGTDPEKAGWTRVAAVDARPKEGEAAGQYGVSIADSTGSLGAYRYLLFDCQPTERDDRFGNTFFSEIDVIDRDALLVTTRPVAEAPTSRPGVKTVEIENGKYHFTIDTSDAPDLTEWAETELAPVVVEWYPKIVAMLPSDGFTAPEKFSITFHKNMDGVANTAGTRINCAEKWFKQNLKGEARGAVVHELVHVVQQYWGRGRRRNAQPNPGWLVEGIPDYIRWYKYEPQSHGADLRPRAVVSARYDGSYRVTANFLNWVTTTYNKPIIEKLNAAMRRGAYDADIWKTETGKTIDELGEEWKASLEKGK